jgi:hypothetical protein
MHLRDALRVKAAAQHSSSELGSAFALALHLHIRSEKHAGCDYPMKLVAESITKKNTQEYELLRTSKEQQRALADFRQVHRSPRLS